MNKDKIYPSMVIRSQAEAIKLLGKENQQLKEHLEVLTSCTLKTLEDYKNYYEDSTKEQILEDTYIDHCGYVNLAHRYAKLESQLKQRDEVIDEISKFIEDNGIDKEMFESCGMYDVNGIEIYKILQKYKGDNNE